MEQYRDFFATAKVTLDNTRKFDLQDVPGGRYELTVEDIVSLVRSGYELYQYNLATEHGG